MTFGVGDSNDNEVRWGILLFRLRFGMDKEEVYALALCLIEFRA